MADKKNINRFVSSPIAHTLLVYISVGWLALEMTDYFINNYSLTERFRDILLIFMVIGLPLSLFLPGISAGTKKPKMKKTRACPGFCGNDPGFQFQPYW